MVSKNTLVEPKFCFAEGRRSVENSPSAATAKVCVDGFLDLLDVLGIPKGKEAPLVLWVSLLASDSLSLGGCVRNRLGDCGCELPCPSESQGLVEETDCHHQAHQEGPGAEAPATKEPWATDHVQFSFTWPLSTLLEKSS